MDSGRFKDDDLAFSLNFQFTSKIKHVAAKLIKDNEITLTLTNRAVEFKTFNAQALKTGIDLKLGLYFKV